MDHRLSLGIFSLLLVFPQEMEQPAAQDRIIAYREVGRIDGERDTLVYFGDVRIGPHGQILLDQVQIRRLILYDSLGRRIRTIGRAGEGPGEFDWLSGYGWLNNDIWAYDAASDRLTFFTEAGSVRRLARVTRAFWPSAERSDSTMRMYGTVEVVTSDNAYLVRARSSAAYVVDSTNTVVSIVAQIPQIQSPSVSIPRSTDALGAVSGGGIVVPFTHRSIWAASANGSVVALATTFFSEAQEESYRVIALNLRGDTLFARTLRYTGERISSRMVDSAIAATIANVRRVNPPPALIRAFQDNARRRVPIWRQPYLRMQVAMDGSVWINLRGAIRGGTRWLAFSKSGEALGTLILPDGMWLLERDGNKAWAVQEDQDGVRSLVLLQLSLPG